MRAICIASGPSLTQADVDACKGKGRVYVVNNAYKLAPWADVLYSCDYRWWKHYRPNFQGEKWTIDEAAARDFKLNHVKPSKDVWSFDAGKVATGFNSGFQALNLAVNHGASHVILLGYDMKYASAGRKHFDRNHHDPLDKPPDFAKWINRFAEAAPLIPAKVINCSRDTALKCFERMPLNEALQRCQP